MNLDLMVYILEINLPNKIKKGAYVINLDEYENTGTYWVSLFVKANKVIYFDSFGIEHIPEEINVFIGNKKTKASIFRIQAYDSITAGITGASLTLIFTIGTGISKSLLKVTKKRKKKHNKIIALAKSKLNTIDIFII